jgi:hypothetical protein
MEPYDEVLDEQRGGNILISANEDFTGVQSTSIGESRPSRNDLMILNLRQKMNLR